MHAFFRCARNQIIMTNSWSDDVRAPKTLLNALKSKEKETFLRLKIEWKDRKCDHFKWTKKSIKQTTVHSLRYILCFKRKSFLLKTPNFSMSVFSIKTNQKAMKFRTPDQSRAIFASACIFHFTDCGEEVRVNNHR